MYSFKEDRIKRQSLSSQAAIAIKSRILSGEIPPGTRLMVDILAEKLGVSRTPIREGLNKLIAQGLVSYDGNSYMVTSYTRKDIEELFPIRRSLEELAVRQAALHISAQKLDEMRHLFKDAKKQIKAKDADFLISIDKKFHEMISESANNNRLRKLLDNLREQIWLIRNLIFSSKMDTNIETPTLEEHRAIFKHLEAGDPDGAAKVMELHLLRGEKRYLEKLDRKTASLTGKD